MGRKTFCLFFLWITVSGQSFDERRPSETPVTFASRFFTEFGALMQDVDDTIYRLTAPISELEENMKRQIVRPNYFDRTRENYRNLQKNLQKKLASYLDTPEDVIKLSDSFNINFQNKGQKSFVDVSLPFLPMNVQVNAKSSTETKSTSTTEGTGVMGTRKITSEDSKLKIPFSDFAGTVNVGDASTNFANENQDHPDASVSNTNPDEFQKRSSNRVKLSKQTSKNDAVEEKSKIFPPRREASEDLNYSARESRKYASEKNTKLNKFEPSEAELDVQGRVLGDILYSESTFDKYFRDILKNHGKWMVDPTIFPPKKVIENIRKIARDPFKNAPNKVTAHRKDTSFSKVSAKPIPKSGNRNIANDKVWETEPIGYKTSNVDSRYEPRSRVVLAFTTDGVPLKLKIDTENENSLQFLHEILTEEGVSLNIPINSRRGIQPAGNDILQLGSGTGSILTQALYLDLSDDRQLNTLLRIL